MGFRLTKQDLKRELRNEVARFYQRDQKLWKLPIIETLRELHEANVCAVLFGGTPRSLLVSRVFEARPGRPRDIDIVVSGSSLTELKSQFEMLIRRETRFGGLQLRRRDWQFDLWPLQQTWAFVNDHVQTPAFSNLPYTTFFNLEAIAIDAWALPGRPRQIYSGDDQFFDGLAGRLLETNLEENPFPELCVVRALIMASSLNFAIGPKLTRYVFTNSGELSPGVLEKLQSQHYGYIRHSGATLHNWIEMIKDHYLQNGPSQFMLPVQRQLEFWPDSVSEAPTKVRVHALSS